MWGTVGSQGPGLFCISSHKAMVKTSDMTKVLSWLGVKREGRTDRRKKGFFHSEGKMSQ